MRTELAVVFSLSLSLLLGGCQLTPQPQPDAAPAEQAPQPAATAQEPLPEEVLPALRIAGDAASVQAWAEYRQYLLVNLNTERELLNQASEQDDVWQLKRTLTQLHPDTPYLTRLRVQMQLSEQLSSLPPALAALFSWDLAVNQKLLEAESAVSAVTRLNAQQHDNIERLQRTNKELQKKIDALTQIEAQLNQPAKPQGGNNGQF